MVVGGVPGNSPAGAPPALAGGFPGGVGGTGVPGAPPPACGSMGGPHGLLTIVPGTAWPGCPAGPAGGAWAPGVPARPRKVSVPTPAVAAVIPCSDHIIG